VPRKTDGMDRSETVAAPELLSSMVERALSPNKE
jgi:hypothetical protein